MAGNGFVLLDSSVHKWDLLCYGQDFVVQRPPREGLVLSPQITQLQLVQEGQATGFSGECRLSTLLCTGILQSSAFTPAAEPQAGARRCTGENPAL